jgi:integrase
MNVILDPPSTGGCPELLSDLRGLVATWVETQSAGDLISELSQFLSSREREGVVSGINAAPRRKRMSATHYQKGSIELSGNWYYVRFRMKVPGQKKRKKMREKVCPSSGPGFLTPSQREVKGQQIVDASGVNDGFLDKKPNPKAVVTFRERGNAMLREVAKRNRKPIASRTLAKWRSSLDTWLIPGLGDLPLSEVNNATVKPLIAEMTKALKPGTVQDHLTLIKLVVASAVNSEGEQLYPVKWNHDFMDVPVVNKREVNAPSFSTEVMSGLAHWRNRRARTIFTLCGASGIRIGEGLGLDIAKHISEDFRTLRIEQKALSGRIENRLKTESSYREIDLDPQVAAIIRGYAAGRTSGLLFRSRTGRPLRTEELLRTHLHPALKSLGYVNPVKGNHQAGTHAFRRFRETHLGKVEGLPRGIRLFWMGHAEANMTDHYDKIKEDRQARREWAERCGVGFELPSRAQVVPISESPRECELVA